jgi:hypothetical protein
MKHMKTVEVPATTTVVADRTTCDFCGATIPTSGYEFAEVTLQCDEGSRYPEGGSGEKTIFDCCANCWGSKVMPAMRALGAEPRIQKWDF